MDEFKRLKSAEAKLTTSSLHDIAIEIATNEELEVPLPNGPASVTEYFIRDFKHKNRICNRAKTGHRIHNAVWTEFIDRSIAYFLEALKKIRD